MLSYCAASIKLLGTDREQDGEGGLPAHVVSVSCTSGRSTEYGAVAISY